MRQDASEGGPWGEANFHCVTSEFGLQIEIVSNQALRLLDLIRPVWRLSNFGGDSDRAAVSAHAQTRVYQPGRRLALEGGSGGGGGRGGARRCGRARAAPLLPPEGGGERCRGRRGGGGLSAGGGRTANELARCLSSRPMSSCLAHNVSRQGKGARTFGRVGRCPSIKHSARAGRRHSGVRLEVSFGGLSVRG